jgi:hypothetical protein
VFYGFIQHGTIGLERGFSRFPVAGIYGIIELPTGGGDTRTLPHVPLPSRFCCPQPFLGTLDIRHRFSPATAFATLLHYS